MTYYLAIDIGASSGRHMLAHLEEDRMVLEEVYRFPNGMVEKNGRKIWDIERLWQEILNGMKECGRQGKIPVSVGVDTWGVDFVLLDEKGERLGDAVAYRDDRTVGMDQKVAAVIPEKQLYYRTGIQKQSFNTIYQLMALKQKEPELLQKADAMLLVPDYFHYLLTGVKGTEYTEASTTQLVDPKTKDWDFELIRELGYPEKLFQKMYRPASYFGEIRPEVAEKIGYRCKVILPATHDTGSAVMAVPTESDQTLYISSGTWSLMGTELKEALCDERSRQCNLTNEGGYNYRFRYLKNIMGLWMIQSVKKEIGQNFSFGEICEMAGKEEIASVVDCNADRFLAPSDMTEEIRKACEETGQQVPESLAEVAAVVYHSLAVCYQQAGEEIAANTGKQFDRIHIVGGGANADYLNRLCAAETGLPVYAGPTEATAIGNLCAQMIEEGVFCDLMEARRCVAKSFAIQKYEPVPMKQM